ncbi:MAG: Pseudouridine synthase [Chlamydiia bacterium]|nr:Pseudouridine synthase [Chlamydiia bacterium]
MRQTIEKEMILLDALVQLAPESSKNTLRTWIKDGRVVIDGVVATLAVLPVHPQQKLEVLPKPLKKEGSLKIVYEDSNIVVVDKPAGLLSVSTNFQTENTAHALLKRRYKPNKVFVVHRLDQDTSGVMIFARSEKAYDVLKRDLAAHDVKRVYYGIVTGHLKGKGSWTSYLLEDKNYFVNSSQDPERGEKATTHYEAVHHSGGKKELTLVRFTLETGKKNQIRVHAQESGHPIHGDDKYGTKERGRLCLHAAELQFLHPITQKPLVFKAPLPKEFLSLLSLAKFVV